MGNNFWEEKSFSDMSRKEWEALCDGCGVCCLEKLEDEDTGDIVSTRVACRFLDIHTCRCGVYEKRYESAPWCFELTPQNVTLISWLPETCAYRRLAEGKALPAWHYLISGTKDSVFQAGISIRGRAVSGEHVHPDDLVDFV